MAKTSKSFLRTLEELEDLLYGSPDLKENLIRGLEKSLAWLGRPAGMIYVAEWNSRAIHPWIQYGASEYWADQAGHPESQLNSSIRAALAEKRPLISQEGEEAAYILPLIYNEAAVGAWAVPGGAFPTSRQGPVDQLARCFARVISVCGLLRVDSENRRDVAALQIVAASLNPDASVNDVQLWILRGMKDLLGCPAAALTLFDDQVPDLAVKKVLFAETDWHSQDVIPIGPSLVQKTLQAERAQYLPEIDQDGSYNAAVDGISEVEIKSILMIPLISNRQMLGVVSAFNLPPENISGGKMNLLNSMSRSLANTVFNLKLIQQLKVINADLEASRWELLHSRNTLRALFDSIPASIYIVDRRYSLIAINMSRSDRTGMRPNQLVGKKCYSALYGRGEACPGCRVNETLLHGKNTARVNRVWVTPDQPLDWEISTFPIFEPAQVPVQAIVLEQDITEKRRLEANLIQNEKLAAVGQLAAGVAHEINNPLSAVIANAQILRTELDPQNPDIIESLDLIELAGMRASQVVRNLLGFARKEQFEFALTDLNETLSGSLSLIQHELVSRSISLFTDLGEELPRIHASREALQGVWINLVMNAIDAVEGEGGEIRITTRYQGSEFRVAIQDNGKGIPPERISRIFEPFYTTKEAGHGTGLGLSVCHRIIKQHGGHIQVESNPGVGTKFVIVLPGGEQ